MSKEVDLDSIQISLNEHQVYRDGVPIHLTRTEWSLLELLALHINKTLTHQFLLQHIWGDTYYNEYHYLHTYIRRLRRKLEPDPQHPRYLLTETGIGYKLAQPKTHTSKTPIVSSSTDNIPPSTVPPLPQQVSLTANRLLGRENDILAIQTLLAQSDVRVLTLTGPLGVGKTQLAQQVVRSVQHQFTDGLYTLFLAPIRDATLVASTLAQIVGVQETAHQTLQESLREALQSKRILLFFDNFEHVLAATPFLNELITIAPQLKILITSRTSLRISSEQIYPIRPLETPDLTMLPMYDILVQNPAVALFTRRSQAVKPDFMLTEANSTIVAAICNRLDGLPLAIELAAARSKLFSPQALLKHLNQQLTLLSYNTIDVPERHYTLRAALDWSYDLLSPEEQYVLTGLGIFAGGCTLEAATAVLTRDHTTIAIPQSLAINPPSSRFSNDHLITSTNLLDYITGLIDHSLVQIEEDANGEPRFVLLETVRTYALTKAAEANHLDMLLQRRATHYVSMIETLSQTAYGPKQGEYIVQLTQEYNNIRAVLQWALESHQDEIALYMSGKLWLLWISSGHLSEGQYLLDAALKSQVDCAPIIWARAWNGAGVIASYQGDNTRAASYLEESLKWWQQSDDKLGSAHVLSNLAIVIEYLGKADQAEQLLEQSLEIRQQLGDDWSIGATLINMGKLATNSGRYKNAEEHCEKSLLIFQETGDFRGVAHSLHVLGKIHLCQSNITEATTYLQKGHTILLELNNYVDAAYVKNNLAHLHLLQGDFHTAIPLLFESLSVCCKSSAQQGIIRCIESFTAILTLQKNHKEAVYLYSAMQQQRRQKQIPQFAEDMYLYHHLVEPAYHHLQEDRHKELRDAGYKMTLTQAITYTQELIVEGRKMIAVEKTNKC